MFESLDINSFDKTIGLKIFFIRFVLFTCYFGEIHTVPSGVHVDGYQESEVPTYPFQQYIQVRKTYTVERIPVYDHESSSSSPANPHASASNNNPTGNSNDHHTASTNNEHGNDGGHQYYVPRLREEISDYKKHEVYEEKGYGDSAYDHHRYKDPPQHQQYYDDDDSSHRSATNHYERKRPSDLLRTPDGSSTRILEYVASNLHDGDAQKKGIYAARSNIYCPEVIDFDLSSKSMGMGKSGNRGAKPRLSGLGSKIQCLKNKYFGREPLPKAIFAEPSESVESVIETPAFDHFFKMVRHNVNSMSSFQNGNVPI